MTCSCSGRGYHLQWTWLWPAAAAAVQSFTADEAKLQSDRRALTAAKYQRNWKMSAFRSNLLCLMVTRLHCTYNVSVKISNVWWEGERDGAFISPHTLWSVLHWWLKHFCNDMNAKWIRGADRPSAALHWGHWITAKFSQKEKKHITHRGSLSEW